MKYDYTALTNIEDSGYRTWGYKDGDPLARAYEGKDEADSIESLLEVVFRRLNMDDRPNGLSAPSLSVGDVIVVHTPDGDASYACQSLGWKPVKTPDWENVPTYLEYRHSRNNHSEA